MVFVKIMVEVVDDESQGHREADRTSLAGDAQVEEAAEYLFAHGIPAYPY